MGTHWEGLNIFLYAEIQWAQNYDHNLDLVELFWYDTKPFSFI